MARDMIVRWAMEEVGQPYEVRLVPWADFKKPEHRRRQPFGQIPTYEEGDLTLFESGAIVLHIAERPPALNLPARVKVRGPLKRDLRQELKVFHMQAVKRRRLLPRRRRACRFFESPN